MSQADPPPVKIKDLIAYLSTLPPEASVHLDKDGWMDDELKWTTPQQLIEQRGLWHFYNEAGYLMINN